MEVQRKRQRLGAGMCANAYEGAVAQRDAEVGTGAETYAGPGMETGIDAETATPAGGRCMDT